ncbi:DMT family transporter [Allorhizobium sp. BGMRC 0089]|uniref:DMT family transporter n=1 Tax=Allorhizobium sonneratiae TaxID=2934936 RepID=UPI0020336C0B|nr:DMT family transporter [Allorhizobium sonneratiae]MCM2290978.1 DMT family transporter [Allorhizobium sonneratiae]
MSAKAYVYLALATLFWGGNAVAGKLAVGHISPMLLTFSRWFMAVIVLTLMSRETLRRDWPKIRPKLPLLLGLGAIGFSLFNGFLYSALHYTSTVNAVIEQGGVPVFIFILNYILFRIAVTPVQIAGFLVSFLGVALTAGHGDLAALFSLKVNSGDALMLLAVACYGIYTLALRFKPDIHWQSLMTILSLGATLAAIPLTLWEASTASLVWPDARGYALIAYCGLLPSLVSQTFYIKGVSVIGANRAGLFINLVPVFGTLLSVLIIGEKLQGFHLIALALVLGGIALAEQGKPKQASAS